MDDEILETVADVFDALDGNSGIEAITGCKQSTVSMWKVANGFPWKQYPAITKALSDRNKVAAPSLFGMKSKGGQP